MIFFYFKSYSPTLLPLSTTLKARQVINLSQSLIIMGNHLEIILLNQAQATAVQKARHILKMTHFTQIFLPRISESNVAVFPGSIMNQSGHISIFFFNSLYFIYYLFLKVDECRHDPRW